MRRCDHLRHPTAPGASRRRRPASRRALQHLRGSAERACRIDHVVHDHAGAAFDFTDDVHHFGDVRLRATLVDDREIAVELLRECPGTHHAADVRRHDEQIRVVLLAQVTQQDRRCVDVVDRDVEEALNLVGVQIHRDDPLDAGNFQHVRDDLRRDRDARRTRAAILTGVAEVGMAAVIRPADARLSASTMIISSIRLSFVGAHVDCRTKTSLPRTFSWISTWISPSEKRLTIALPRGFQGY